MKLLHFYFLRVFVRACGGQRTTYRECVASRCLARVVGVGAVTHWPGGNIYRHVNGGNYDGVKTKVESAN